MNVDDANYAATTDTTNQDLEDSFNISDIDLEMGLEDYEENYQQLDNLDVVSVAQVDLFLTNLYKYFIGRGFRNIIVTQIVNLSLVTFLVLFCIWLFSCVRFDILMNMRDPGQVYHISQIINWSGLASMHWYLVISLILFCAFFVWKIIRIGYDTQKMREMQHFYNVHLAISDFELSTIRWQKVVEKVQELQEQHHFYLGKDEFTLHNVANHVLKKENYLVAMFNKEIFDFTIPHTHAPFFTKTMEWNIQYAMINYLFDDRMKLKKDFLDFHKREELANGLQKRLTLMAVLNLILAPFLGLFLIFWGVFERGQEFYKTPSKLSSRRWSHLAKWNFREFNELPHVFYERMKLSTKYADEYLQQFPNYWLSDIAKLGAFIISTFLFVMFIGMFLNDTILFHLELGADKSVFWWMGILSTALLVARGFIKESYIFYPEKKLKKVAEYIHYIPEEWIDNASKYRVKYRFLQLYEYRVWVMFKEILGIIINPIMMLTRLRNDSLAIVDFVRDYTLSHPQLGNVCKFSVFEYSDDPMMNSQKLSQLNNVCRLKKMEKSVFYFKQNTVTPSGSLLDTSVFANPSHNVRLHQPMQATLRNFNDMSFSPTAQQNFGDVSVSTFNSVYRPSGPQNSMMYSQYTNRQTKVTRNPNSPNSPTSAQNSVFLPPMLSTLPTSSLSSTSPTLTKDENPSADTINSGHLVDDLEALEEEQVNNTDGGPNMMEVFVGNIKK